MSDVKRSSGVDPEVNLGKVHYVWLCQVYIKQHTLALKPKGDITRDPKEGYKCKL